MIVIPDVYCSRCATPAQPGATSCARCGAGLVTGPPAGSDPESTYVPGRDASTVHGAHWDAAASGAPDHGTPGYGNPGYSESGYSEPGYSEPGYSEPGSRRPAPPREFGTAVFVAVGVAAVAVIAVAVIAFVVVRRGDGGRSTSANPAGAVTTTVPAAQPSKFGVATLGAGPPTVTVVRSATASRPVAPKAPRTVAALRRLYDAATPVDPTPYENPDNPTLSFTSHTGNIECSIRTGGEDPVSAQCVIGTYDFPQPGPDCDNGAILTVDGYGSPTYSGCSTVPYSTTSAELPYGASISAGEFGCVDDTVGVSCVDLATNTGFTLSRQQFVPVS